MCRTNDMRKWMNDSGTEITEIGKPNQHTKVAKKNGVVKLFNIQQHFLHSYTR